jgi:aryl-alcohol dehydrogenase-like predicted oxidoreductase
VHWTRADDVLRQAGDLEDRVLLSCSLPMNEDDTALVVGRTSSGAERLAAAKGVSPSQLALAWVLARGEDLVAIPGTNRVKYLEENAGAERVSLSADEQRAIDAIFPLGASSGARYADMGTVHR